MICMIKVLEWRWQRNGKARVGLTMELSDRENDSEGEDSLERSLDVDEAEESMLVAYETLAPEMRPESGSRGKSVK